LPDKSRPVTDFFPTVCPHDCPSVCALEVERLAADRVGRVRGRAQPYTDGAICAKVARYAERVHHPERLRTPLVRVGAKGEGRFEPVSWDAALDLVADRFRDTAARFGSEAIWPVHYAGTMGLVQRDGIHRLRHALKTSRMAETICVGVTDAGWRVGVGAKKGVDPREMAESDLIVVWGGNPVATQVTVMHWIAKARKQRGARLVVVDPYRTPTAEKADTHLMLRPGTDGALACAVMHVLFRDGMADRDYLERHTSNWRELEAHLRQRSPAWAAAITGLGEAEIEDFARLYGSTPRAFLRIGYGFGRQRNGAVNMHAVTCLPAVTGAWRHRGGGALYSGSGQYGLDKTLIEGLDLRDPATRVLDQSRIGPVLCGEDLQGGPPVKAMLIQNHNPAVVAPDTTRVRAGLQRDDLFVCVHEQFMTETARLADLVLPATTFLEHDDLYTAGGHTFLQVAKAVITPYAESRSNHEVLQGLAQRLGLSHPGFSLSAWELIDATLRASGRPGAEQLYAAGWLDCAGSFEDQHFLTGFPNGTGRFAFAPDWLQAGPHHADMPALPDHWAVIEEADAEHPYRLVTAPSRHFLNTSFTETPTSRRQAGEPTALIHPEDLAAAGIGAQARIGNRRGMIEVAARPFDGVQRGVIVVEGIWPNGDFSGGTGVNGLVGADAVRPNGGAAFHDVAVWVRPAD
jgi:anaerobic selenocysteine-containing dehydrogenase